MVHFHINLFGLHIPVTFTEEQIEQILGGLVKAIGGDKAKATLDKIIAAAETVQAAAEGG